MWISLTSRVRLLFVMFLFVMFLIAVSANETSSIEQNTSEVAPCGTKTNAVAD